MLQAASAAHGRFQLTFRDSGATRAGAGLVKLRGAWYSRDGRPGMGPLAAQPRGSDARATPAGEPREPGELAERRLPSCSVAPACLGGSSDRTHHLVVPPHSARTTISYTRAVPATGLVSTSLPAGSLQIDRHPPRGHGPADKRVLVRPCLWNLCTVFPCAYTPREYDGSAR